MSLAFFLFASSLSGFLPVAAYFGRLCEEHGTQQVSKNKSRFFSLRCFGFRNLHSFFEGNEGFSGRITQNGQVLTFFFG